MPSSTGLNRRGFLRRAAGVTVGALGLPAVASSSALGADAPSNQITMGFIGLGGMGTGHLNGFLGAADVRVLALCDVDSTVVANSKNKVDTKYDNTDCTAYHDFRDLLARDDIDAVLIGTPDHWHAIPSILAAQAGKDVYCEKPMTHTLREGRAVCTAVEQSGAIFQTGSQQRSEGRFKFACELIRNGYIGEVQSIEVVLPDGFAGEAAPEYPEVPAELDYEFWVGPAAWAPYHPARCKNGWRQWLGFGGGKHMDWVGHHADIAQMSMGTDRTGPTEVEGLIWAVPVEGVLNGALDYQYRCTYPSGVTLTVNNTAKASEEFRACGDLGVLWTGQDGHFLWVSRSGLVTGPESLATTKLTGDDFRFSPAIGHTREFLNSVRTRREPSATAEVGHRSASVGHIGQIAMQLGRKLTWNPDTELFLDDDQANGMLGRADRGDWGL